MSSMGLLFFVLFIPGSDSLWHHWSLWSFLLLCRGKRNNCILFLVRAGRQKWMKWEFLIDKFMLVSMDTTDIYMYVTVIKEFVRIFVNMQLMCDFVIESQLLWNWIKMFLRYSLTYQKLLLITQLVNFVSTRHVDSLINNSISSIIFFLIFHG